MKVLITGTSGFVGGNLKSIMENNGISVISAGRNLNSDIICDFTEPQSLANLNLSNFNAVIHCAGPIDEDFTKSKKKPFIHAKDGTEALLEKVKYFKVKNYIHFSTAHVYGNFLGEINEKKKPEPISDYARAHLAAEDITCAKLNGSDTNCLILRPLTIYDIPAEPLKFKRWHLIPYSFPVDLFSNKILKLKTSGKQYRNFISMKSIASFLVDCLVQKRISKVQKVNLVGSQTIQVIEFAALCQKIIKIHYNFTPTIHVVEESEKNFNDHKFKFSSKFNLRDDKEGLTKFIIDLLETRTDKRFKKLWQRI